MQFIFITYNIQYNIQVQQNIEKHSEKLFYFIYIPFYYVIVLLMKQY